MREHNDPGRMSLIRAVRTPLGFFTLTSLIVEAVLGTLALTLTGHAQLIALYGMIGALVLLIATVALIVMYRPNALTITERPRDPEAVDMPDVTVADVNTLSLSILEVLRKCQDRYPDRSKFLRIFTADAGDLLTYMTSVIRTQWLRNTVFEFAIVDPEFERLDEASPRFRRNAAESIELLRELAEDSNLAKREVRINSTRLYRFFPNIWGVLIDDIALWIGFHNWVDRGGIKRLEGTEFGVIRIEPGHPLWPRLSTLFNSWYECSESKGS